MARMTRITPFVLVADMDRALSFYEGRLGFTCGMRAENYAFLRRDDVALRLLEVGEDCDLSDPARQLHCYVDVDDVDALWAELQRGLAQLPAGRVRAPFDTDYGQRELHVIDEDVTLISFGSTLPR